MALALWIALSREAMAAAVLSIWERALASLAHWTQPSAPRRMAVRHEAAAR
jgi:hypothetical protein